MNSPFLKAIGSLTLVGFLACSSSDVWAGISALPLILVETQQLADSSTELVSFTDIASKVPAGTQHLLVEVSASSTFAVSEMAEFRLNGDGGFNYRRHYLRATDSAFAKSAGLRREAWVVDIPSASAGGHSSATVLLPWAFGDDYKTALGYTSSHGDRLTHGKAHWLDTDPISSIDIGTFSETSKFAAGSIFRLWAVDERYRVAEAELASNGPLGVSYVPQAGEHLVAMLHARSDESATNGDRVHHVLNGDPVDGNYLAQRLAAEIPAIQDTLANNGRIAYIPSDNMAAGHYGESVSLYPWFRDTTRDRTYLFQHANDDLNYTPSQIESGRWNDSSAITGIDYSLEAGGTDFVAGSKVALYRTKAPLERLVLAQDQPSVTLQLPDGIVGAAQILVSARSDLLAGYDGFTMSVNGDVNSENYLVQWMGATAGEHDGARENSREVGVLPGTSASAGAYGGGIVTLFEVSSNDRQKEFLYLGGAAEERVQMSGGAWLAADSVSSVTFYPAHGGSFKAGSTFEIWVQQNPELWGDYSNNGVVDAIDYTVWRDAMTAGWSLLNDATPGVVDASDFVYWRAHFGESLGGGAAVVPEPGLGSFLLVSPAIMAVWRRRLP